LKHFCKRYKRNKKIEKEKEEKKRKYEKGQGAPFRPRLEASPWPNKAPPEPVSLFPSLCH
jgi:hypothetical protein